MTQKRRNNKKIIWLGLGLILIIAIVVGIVVSINNNSGNGKTNDSETAKVEEPENNKEGEANQESTEKTVIGNNEQKPTQYEGENPNAAEELSGVVTYSGVNDEKLMIRVNIDQYLTEGTCDLTLRRNGNIIYSDTANIVGGASTATCQGFDIAASDLGERDLEIIINLSANDKSGVIRGEANI